MGESTSGGSADYSPPIGHIAVNLEARPQFTFSFEQPQKRFGGAMGVSLLTHAAIFAAFIIVARFAPVTQAVDLVREANKNIVWLAIPGPGGGGGGGGNKSPDPPRKAELPGKDKITVPVAKAPKLENPEIKDEPKPVQQLSIPAMVTAEGEQKVPGVLESTIASGESQGSGTGGGAGSGSGTGIGPGQGSGLGPGWGGGTGGGAYRIGNGVQPPRILREVKPQYTAEAMRAKVQGKVLLECVVLADGTVGNVEIVRSLDPTFGLDQEAMKAAKQWRFVPGTRMGEPVAVLVTLELSFTLR